MRNLRAIAVRELKAYFNSPIAYIVVAAFLAISGALYFWPVFIVGQSTMRSFFQVTPLLFVVFAPAVSMRLISEELRSGTLELLTTSRYGTTRSSSASSWPRWGSSVQGC